LGVTEIEKNSYLYEVPIRYDANGYVGSHQIWIDRYIDTDTGEVISEQQRAAEPLAEAAIIDLVGEQAVVMAQQIDRLNKGTWKTRVNTGPPYVL